MNHAKMGEHWFEVRTPNREFNGERAGIIFVDGLGHTRCGLAANECALLGYKIRNCQTGVEVQQNPVRTGYDEARNTHRATRRVGGKF